MPSPRPPAPIIAVIPAWNARDRLTGVLAALADQVDGIVVVDNGSGDGTADALAAGGAHQAGELVSNVGGVGDGGDVGDVGSSNDVGRLDPLRTTLIRNPDNRGYAEAVNQGIERALADGAAAVLLVNDDAIFEPGAVRALASALAAAPDVGAATAHLTYADRPDVLNGAGGSWWPHRARVGLRGSGEPDDGRYAAAPDVAYPSGAAALLRHEAIAAVGGMDERYRLYYEDADWGLRAQAAGWRTVYVPGAHVRHVGWAGTRSDPAKRRYYNVRNRLLFAREHAPLTGRLWAWGATAWLVGKQLMRWWWPSRRRDAEAVFAAVADHVRRRYGRGTFDR